MGLASACVTSNGAARSFFFSVAAFLWLFTRRTAGPGPRAWVKFAALLRAPRSWLRARRVPKRARTASVSLARPASLSRVGRRRLRPVLKHGPRSLTCARVIGFTKPKGAVKAKAACSLGVIPRGRNPGASRRPRIVGSSKSVHVGTRKMVNYAWPG